MSSTPRPAAIITGAERGIVAGLAAAVHRCGHAVVATSRSILVTDGILHIDGGQSAGH
jgi:NAD(P)-dependent dehydrogenase (short-subunit alcohol dehydrogenase family)